MTLLEQIKSAESVEALREFLYRAETAELQAEICLRETQLIGGPRWCPVCGVELTDADTAPCSLEYGVRCGAVS